MFRILFPFIVILPILLTGKKVVINSQFCKATPDAEMSLNGKYLLYRNKKESLKIIDIEKNTLVAQLGKWGGQSGKFFYPVPLSTNVNNPLFYLLDYGDIFEVSENFQLNKTKRRLYSFEYDFGGNSSQWASNYYIFNSRSILFVGADKKTDAGVFLTYSDLNGLTTKKILSLAVDTLRGYLPYSGSLAVGYDNRRAVFAYNSYDVVRVINLEHKTSFLIQRQLNNPDISIVRESYNRHFRYYVKTVAGYKYFYCLYFGNFADRLFSGKQTNSLLEQYNWNGNLIKVYKLDHVGLSFCINEAENKLLLLSVAKSGLSVIYEYELI